MALRDMEMEILKLQMLITGELQTQQEIIEEEIRLADTSRLVPGLSETDLIQQLVSFTLPQDQPLTDLPTTNDRSFSSCNMTAT
jgi:hypothetical protein